jgi:hypothetical protein
MSRQRRFLRRVLWLLAFACAFACAAPAFAQKAFGVDPVAPGPPAATGTEQALVARYWALGRPRFFFGTTLEAGYAYVRPRFGVGYGLPYWRWIGLETYPIVSLGSVGGYAGIGAAVPGLQFRAGGRYTFPFSRFYLQPRESFTRFDTELREGDRATYLSLEAELSGTVPVPAGSLFAVATAYRVMMVPDGFYLYEENLRRAARVSVRLRSRRRDPARPRRRSDRPAGTRRVRGASRGRRFGLDRRAPRRASFAGAGDREPGLARARGGGFRSARRAIPLGDGFDSGSRSGATRAREGDRTRRGVTPATERPKDRG